MILRVTARSGLQQKPWAATFARRATRNAPSLRGHSHNFHSTTQSTNEGIHGFSSVGRQFFGKIRSFAQSCASAAMSHRYQLLYGGFAATLFQQTIRSIRCDNAVPFTSKEDDEMIPLDTFPGFKSLVIESKLNISDCVHQSPHVKNSVGDALHSDEQKLSHDACSSTCGSAEKAQSKLFAIIAAQAEQIDALRATVAQLLEENRQLHRRIEGSITAELCEKEARLLVEDKLQQLAAHSHKVEQESQQYQCIANELKDRTMCHICMERPINQYYRTCGHAVSCEHCAIRMASQPNDCCPICRAPHANSLRMPIYGLFG